MARTKQQRSLRPRPPSKSRPGCPCRRRGFPWCVGRAGRMAGADPNTNAVPGGAVLALAETNAPRSPVLTLHRALRFSVISWKFGSDISRDCGGSLSPFQQKTGWLGLFSRQSFPVGTLPVCFPPGCLATTRQFMVSFRRRTRAGVEPAVVRSARGSSKVNVPPLRVPPACSPRTAPPLPAASARRP